MNRGYVRPEEVYGAIIEETMEAREDGIYFVKRFRAPNEATSIEERLIMTKEVFAEAYNKYIKGGSSPE